MASCKGCLRSTCAYQTIKQVRIEDPILGFLYYTFLVGIFLYIVIYQLLYQTRYAKFEDPIGTARLQLQGPVVDHCDPMRSPTCEYDFTPVHELPYCSQSNHSTYKGQKTYPCKDWDSFDVVSPVTGGSPFYVATRVTESKQSFACDVPPEGGACKQTYRFGCNGTFDYDPNCENWSMDTFFVADIERFTLLLDHSVRAASLPNVQADARDMDGHLMDCDGGVVEPSHNDEGQDFFTLDRLLSVAEYHDESNTKKCGIKLDDPSTVDSGGGAPSSNRYDGMILLILIEYQNVLPWSGPQDVIEYTYKVQYIKGTKSKVTEQIFESYPNKRVTRNIHGLKIVVLQSGQLGRFDLQTLLVQLTTSLALLAVSTTVVDLMMTRVLPHRKAYRVAKIQEVEVDPDEDLVIAHPDGINRYRKPAYGLLNSS